MKWLTLMIFLFVASNVYAASISISPSSLVFELYRGETSEAELTISNPSDEALNFRLEAEELPGWFSFSEQEGTLPAGSTRQIAVKAEPPLDASNGEYSTFITAHFEEEGSGQELALNLAASIKAKLKISGKQVVDLQVRDISVGSTEQGMPLVFIAELKNNGNVRASPFAEISIRKNSRQITRQSAELPELLPGSAQKPQINLSTEDLEPGNYTASVSIMLSNRKINERQLNLTILPYGTFTRAGRFVKLSMDEKPEIGKISKLTAQFANTGSIAARVKLLTEVYLEDELTGVIESEELLVNPSETAELESYFSPESTGSYTLISKVSFEGKQSKPAKLEFAVASNSNVKFEAKGIIISAAIVLMGLMLFYHKEVWKLVGRKIEGKVYYCIDCNRPIKHKGRCMICNVTARKRLDAQEKKYAN